MIAVVAMARKADSERVKLAMDIMLAGTSQLGTIFQQRYVQLASQKQPRKAKPPKSAPANGPLQRKQPASSTDIGADGKMGMAQWLKENGGISGVNSTGSSATKAEIERKFRIHVAGKAEQFGLVDRLGSFTSMEMAAAIEHGSGDIVILATVDRKTGKFQPKLISEDVSLREKLWEMRGAAIMETSEYHRNKDTFLEELRQKNAITAAKVANAFKKISSPKKTEEHVALIGKVCVNA